MYQLRTPAPALRRFIEHYWFVSEAEGETVDLRVDVFVDARADLIFNFGAPYQRGTIGGDTVEHHASNLDAQRLVPIRIAQRGRVRTTGVRFHLAGLGPFVDRALAPFTNETPPPESVFGPDVSALENALEKAQTIDDEARLLDDFFLGRLTRDAAHATFERALASLVESGGNATVDRVATAAGVSGRQVERLFARWVGLTPKTVGRVLRFQSTLRALMRDPKVSLAEVAAAAGYFDQAHFVKEFKKMTGGVPRGYRGYYPKTSPTDFAPNVVVFLPPLEGA